MLERPLNTTNAIKLVILTVLRLKARILRKILRRRVSVCLPLLETLDISKIQYKKILLQSVCRLASYSQVFSTLQPVYDREEIPSENQSKILHCREGGIVITKYVYSVKIKSLYTVLTWCLQQGCSVIDSNDWHSQNSLVTRPIVDIVLGLFYNSSGKIHENVH